MIPFRVKLLTETAKAPERSNDGDLFDLFADDFCGKNLIDTILVNHNLSDEFFSVLKDEDETFNAIYDSKECHLKPRGRILVKTGIAIELPRKWFYCQVPGEQYFEGWRFDSEIKGFYGGEEIAAYAVADIRPRSGLALKHGITVLNTPGTIDNSYRKEIGVIIYNAGHEPYTIKKGDKIAQMLIRPLYPSSFEIVKDFEDTGRGGYGSTGV